MEDEILHSSTQEMKHMQDEVSSEKGKVKDNSNLFNYTLPPTSRPFTMDRKHVKVYPNDNQTNFTVDTSGKQITFSITGGDGTCLAPHTVNMTGHFHVNMVNDADRVYCAAGMFGALARLEILAFNGETVCDISAPDILATILLRGSCPNSYFETVGTEFLMPSRVAKNRGQLQFQTIPAANIKATGAFEVNTLNAYNALATTEGINHLPPGEKVIPYKLGGSYVPVGNADDAVMTGRGSTPVGATNNALFALNDYIEFTNPLRYRDARTIRWYNREGSSFCLPLWIIIPLFTPGKYIPFDAFKKLDIRLTFNQPDQFLTEWTTGAAVTYGFKNLALEYQCVRINDALAFALRKKMQEPDGLNFYTRNYWRTSAQFPDNISSGSITIQRNIGDATAIFFVVRNLSAYQNANAAQRMQADKYYFHSFGTLPVASRVVQGDAADSVVPQTFRWYLQIGNERIPSQYIDTVASELCHIQQAFGKYGDISNQVFSHEDFADGLAVRGMNLEIDPLSQSGMSFTGLNLQNGLQLQLNFDGMNTTAPANVNKMFEVFLEFSQTVSMRHNKNSVTIIVKQ
jgi:hypothetical protein